MIPGSRSAGSRGSTRHTVLTAACATFADSRAINVHTVIVYDALARSGIARNGIRLQACHSDRIRPVAEAVFHVAAQVTSCPTHPCSNAGMNIIGTLDPLEAMRAQPQATPLSFGSTDTL